MRWFSLIVLLLLAGCGKREPHAPPSSSYTLLTVTADAQQWVARAPVSRSYTLVAGTGSMLPLFHKNAVLLLEHSDGTDLMAGDIAIYQRKGGTTVHRVMEVGADAILFSGDNNNASDGWVPKGAVLWRVAGILYATR